MRRPGGSAAPQGTISRHSESTMKHTALVRIAIASAFAAGSLSGCSTYHSVVNYIASDSAGTCPDAAILASTSTLPAFDPAKGADPSNVQYTIVLTNVRTRCDYSKRTNEVDSNLTLTFNATRQPGGGELSYRVPYYVALTNNGEIKDKQIHWLQFQFPQSASSVTAEDAVNSIEFKVERGKRSYEYHFIVGFQLTKSQLEYNEKIGQYEP